MDSETIENLTEQDWAALKNAGQDMHRTVWNGDKKGTVTTDTPGLGKTVLEYEYDAAKKSVVFKVKEKPEKISTDVIWFALGATMNYVTAGPRKTF